MQRWAFLADPEEYGWTELVRDGAAVWDGVSAAPAQKHLRSAAHGDLVLIYHTAPEKALVGTARLVSDPQPAEEGGKQVVVEIEPVVALRRPLPLDELKADAVMADMPFVRMPRVAVQPVTVEQWERVMQASGTDLGSSVDVDPTDAGGP